MMMPGIENNGGDLAVEDIMQLHFKVYSKR